MERKVAEGEYSKIDGSGASIGESANKAWKRAWELTTTGKIHRAFSKDYEIVVTADYSGDGNAHCYLYIALRK